MRGWKGSKLEIRHSHEDLGKTKVTLGFMRIKTKIKLKQKPYLLTNK